MGSFLRLLWVAMGFTLLNCDFAKDIFQKWFGEKVFWRVFLGLLWTLHGESRKSACKCYIGLRIYMVKVANRYVNGLGMLWGDSQIAISLNTS